MQQQMIQGFRLSPQQERVWLLQRAGRSTYRAECVITVDGELHRTILAKALDQVAARHEILRTTFHTLSATDVPVQAIADHNISSIDLHDLSDLNGQEQEAAIGALVHEMNDRPFDFQLGPLLRVTLINLSTEKHALVIGMPALCADLTTLRNLAREIGQAYTACSRNEELGGQAMQYADFAEWQNELLETEDAHAGREYWRRQDVSDLISLPLPLETPRSEGLAFNPAILTLTINSDVAAKMEALAAELDVPFNAVLLACWQGLVFRLTGQPDIVVGNYSDGRNFEELESALGLFAKYLPLRCKLAEQLRFSDLVKQTTQSMREADKWQEYYNWREFQRPVSGDNSLLFPICFEFVEQAGEHLAGDVWFSMRKQYACIDRFKIKLSCAPANGSLTAEFHYDANSLSPENVERLAERYGKVLESAVNNPQAALSELDIVGEVERHELLVEFNDTEVEYAKDLCLHRLFEAQVERTPDAVAIVYEDQRLTYRELNARANQLARHLRTLGIGPEARVALCVERSLEMVIGLLGILKAGGAYVPLDTALPKERLAFMLEDSGASIVLTQERFLGDLPGEVAELVCLDADWERIAKQSGENPISETTAENLVYFIFTSGSTGKPKGVAVEHRQLVNYTNAILARLDLPAGSSFAMISTLAADLGNTALFPALCSGGRLHLVSQERAIAPDELAEYFGRHEIDCLKIVPSHLTALLSAARPEQILPRKRLVLGGEACSPALIEKIQKLAPGCCILNHYGPTETTVGAVTYRIKPEPGEGIPASLPLGRPIANTQLYILDEQLNPAPIAVAGELFISGDGLARGYLNRAELTAERFLPNPFSARAGARMYRTGDLARYRDDGQVEFLGRGDHQVKLRGYRIELGEIEARLASHPAVRQCAVAVRDDQAGNQRLVGYVVGEAGEPVSAAELRDYLRQALPEYMVPSRFVLLAEMPLTANGKLDRQALAAVELSGSPQEEDFTGPRTAVEEALAQIWGKVLGLDRVSVSDNFFELGGDSIMGIQVIARANHLGLRLTPRQLFEHQTIAGLAEVAIPNQAVEVEQGIVSGAVPLTPIQRRFFEQNLPAPHYYNQSVLIEVPQGTNPTLLERGTNQLLIHHDALRLRFNREPKGWQQYIMGFEEKAVFSRADLSKLPQSEQLSTIGKIAAGLQASLNLLHGPIVRVAFFDLGSQRTGRLLLVIHHLAVDGVSWRILLDDLETAYRQLNGGASINLPPKTTSFRQWAERLVEFAESRRLEQELGYWLDESRLRVKRLAVDYPAGINSVASARTVSISLTVEETRALLQEVPRAYNTQINDALLTALIQTFSKWTDEPELLVDLEAHGREDIVEGMDLSRTVGWFTSVFPILLRLRESANPGDALKAIKEQLRVIPNRGIGYGLLRYMSAAAERLKALPQAEVSFNYLGQFDHESVEASGFRRSDEFIGLCQSSEGARRYLLTINGHILQGRLKLNWTYSENLHRRSTIETLAYSFAEALRLIISHCRASSSRGFTPSDFPKARVSQNDLNKVLARLGKSSGGNRN